MHKVLLVRQHDAKRAVVVETLAVGLIHELVRLAHLEGVERAFGAFFFLVRELPEVCTVFPLLIVIFVLDLVAEHEHSALVKLIVHEANDATRRLLGLFFYFHQLALGSEPTLLDVVRANDADDAEGLEQSQLRRDIQIFLFLFQPLRRGCAGWLDVRRRWLHFLELRVALGARAFLDDH